MARQLIVRRPSQPVSYVVHTPASSRSLESVKKEVEEGREKGIVCPACSQFAKVYKRKLNVSMAKSLVWLHTTDQDSDGWVYVAEKAPKWLLRARELPKLAYWGLVEEKPKNAENKHQRTSGIWRLTDEGIAFVTGQTKMPAHLFIYNNKVLEASKVQIHIREAFKTPFDYEEMMKSAK